jgi:hypothetical protein
LIKINGFGRARPGALLAFLFIQKQAVLRVYGVGGRGCLSIRNVDGLPMGEIFIIGIWNWNGTIGSANPACRAFFFIHVAGLFAHPHTEVPGISRNLLHGGIGDDFDVGVSGRLNEPGSENSDGTIVGRKGLIQSSHYTADGCRLLHQINIKASIG